MLGKEGRKHLIKNMRNMQ